MCKSYENELKQGKFQINNVDCSSGTGYNLHLLSMRGQHLI